MFIVLSAQVRLLIVIRIFTRLRWIQVSTNCWQRKYFFGVSRGWLLLHCLLGGNRYCWRWIRPRVFHGPVQPIHWQNLTIHFNNRSLYFFKTRNNFQVMTARLLFLPRALYVSPKISSLKKFNLALDALNWHLEKCSLTEIQTHCRTSTLSTIFFIFYL